MSERNIHITTVDPVAVLGPNDQHLRAIRELFPKLNLVARGNELRVIGPPEQVELFLERFEQLQRHVLKYNELPRKVLDEIMGSGDGESAEEGSNGAGVIVHGNSGLRVKARTRNQQRLDQTLAMLKSEGINCLGILADAAIEEDNQRMAHAVISHFGRIDILINNAGVSAAQPIGKVTGEGLDETFNVNVRNLILLTEEAVEDDFGVQLELTSALQSTTSNPFRDVRTLAEHISGMLNGA